jgi:hypothetical protein
VKKIAQRQLPLSLPLRSDKGWALANADDKIIGGTFAYTRHRCISEFVGTDRTGHERRNNWRMWYRKYGIRCVKVTVCSAVEYAVLHLTQLDHQSCAEKIRVLEEAADDTAYQRDMDS